MIKRIAAVALVALMMMALLIPAAMAGDNTPDAHAGYYYVKTGNGKNLNVRDNPNGKVVGTLKYGTRVYVDAFSTSQWALITYRYNNGYGTGNYAAYVSTSCLTRKNPGQYQGASSSAKSADAVISSAKKVASPFTVVSRPSRDAGWVNLRRTPSTNAKVLVKCQKGRKLTVLAEMKDWYQVQDQATGTIGYISRKFVSRV